jgi:hypothetical protein
MAIVASATDRRPHVERIECGEFLDIALDQLVPSRQSSPRTCNVVPCTVTSSTTEEAIGFGRTGERNAKVPVGFPV